MLLGDGVGVALLAGRVGPHRAAPGRPHHLGVEHLGGPHVLAHHVDGPGHLGGVEALARLEHQHQLVEQPGHPLGLGTLDGDAGCPARRCGCRGKASSIRRSSSSRWPRRPGHQVVVGDQGLGPDRRRRARSDAGLARGGAHPAARSAGARRARGGAGGAPSSRRRAHVEDEPVAPVGPADALGLGHLPGRHQQGGQVVGVLGPEGRRRSRCGARGTTSTWTGAAGLMSRKATVRSVSCTMSAGTSPATIPQKMQSLIGAPVVAFGLCRRG